MILDGNGNDVSANYAHIANVNPIRYRGYYYDIESGFYYLNSRYYDPEIGRFINADGYVSTGQGVLGHNMFAYCLNNPVNMVDPSGMKCHILEGGRYGPECPTDENGYCHLCDRQDCCLYYTEEQLESFLIVALTIYGEEHGSTVYNDWQDGQRAIGTIILNRYNAKSRVYGLTIVDICTNGQFDGYSSGKRQYSQGQLDKIAWDHAQLIASYVINGLSGKIGAPSGITNNHTYFNSTSTFNNNLSKNNGKFSFGLGTTPVSPKGVITYGGNTFFYY